MDEIKKWAFSVCCAAVAGGIMNMFLPKGNSEKIFKSVFCVFFLGVIISPLSELTADFPEYIKNFEEKEKSGIYDINDFTSNSETFIENRIKEDTETVLYEYGYTAKDIFISVNILNDGSINIDKFALTFEKTENSDEIKKAVFQKTGIEPEIIYDGEN